MNNNRRKEIKDVLDRIKGFEIEISETMSKLEDLKSDMEDILTDEENARDNIPESLQDSEQYEKADVACDNLANAVDLLDNIISTPADFQEVIAYLENAME